jgi:hypothetical protein
MWQIQAFPSRMAPLVWTALLWFALALGVAYWVLHLGQVGHMRAEVPVAVQARSAAAGPGDMAVVLGAARAGSAETAAAGAARWRLLGVVSADSGQGSALLAQESGPARAYTVGQSLEGGWTLLRVAPGRAYLQAPGTPPGAAPELVLPSRDKP